MSTTTIPALPAPLASGAGDRNSRLRSLVRGQVDDAAWARPALIALLVATAVAYLINLTASGDANSFYAAAVQAGTKSWKAFFFGSLDSSNFITVDKPPASLWVMELSGRLFGFSSASMLVPQVLEGVVAVGLLASAVKRWFGPGAGLLAGAMLALTPVAALMFRFNNPDALLVCLLVASAYCLVRALEGGSTRWMIAVGTLLGFAFLAKMMQAFLVIPGFALVYMVAAPVSVRRRAAQLVAGGVAVLVSCGWWVAIVALWPAASRPMIDGSPDNSILNLIFDYNGFSRLSGGTGGANFSGNTGVFRLFNDLLGAQASWLLPAAVIVLVGGLVWRWRAPRTDRTRAGLLLWGGWLVVTGAVFSFSSGVIHTYYTVALTPAIAALVGIGASVLWHRREQLIARALLATGIAVTAGWAVVLLARDSSWEPWLTPLIIVAAVVAIAGLLAPLRTSSRLSRRIEATVAVAAAVACLTAPLAYSAQTISTAHTGSIPVAGPASASSGGFGGGAGGGGGATTVSSALKKLLESGSSGYRWVAATDGSQNAASLELATDGAAVMAIGGFNGEGGNITLAKFKAYVKAGDIHYYIVSSTKGAPSGVASGSPTGRTGGLPSGKAGGLPSGKAGGLPSGKAGGLPNGKAGGPPTGKTGSAPTGLPGGSSKSGFPSGAGGGAGLGGPGASSQSSTAITAWVKAHYKSETVGGETVYVLTEPISS